MNILSLFEKEHKMNDHDLPDLGIQWLLDAISLNICSAGLALEVISIGQPLNENLTRFLQIFVDTNESIINNLRYCYGKATDRVARLGMTPDISEGFLEIQIDFICQFKAVAIRVLAGKKIGQRRLRKMFKSTHFILDFCQTLIAYES